MRYIFRDPDLGWTFDAYFAYIESIQAEMPPHLYAFAVNDENYDLTSHTSLHDAWLDYFTISEPVNGQHQAERSLRIETCYLGPFHDCRIYLSYGKVRAYDLRCPQLDTPRQNGGHSDLLLHEIRLVEPGVFEHELLFDRGTTMTVRFEEFEHRIDWFDKAK